MVHKLDHAFEVHPTAKPLYERLRAAAKLGSLLKPLYAQLLRGSYALTLDYPVAFERRWTESEPNAALLRLVQAGQERYSRNLASFCAYAHHLAAIPLHAEDSSSPEWAKSMFPPIDAISLYGFIADRAPATYIEVGSGTSTKFARRAISDHSLPTRLISIDPQPRAEISALCDEAIREPLERLDPTLFDQLGPGDMVLVDGSHRCLTNSDVTALFLDVFPRIPAGVLVGIHDIFLPYDYPDTFVQRFYSEQYVLAALLLGDAGRRFQIELPIAYMIATGQLQAFGPVWDVLPPGFQPDGAMFWLTLGP
jgi:hypothetical protein